ncbi:M1 family metallopeptidase [Mariniflexile sp. AS56]|uniref:M1 family metallopeptidase n=1 Tax=Mariniflexile sp. AS56 TaxID=3063957 RepID=UPI0026EDFBE3|nr:M1 family metallopeptidase [Mariniflexile sp. AS56]MDO7172891.1 M1 family metallopeptidase [Mariniflexile sp. AS56]
MPVEFQAAYANNTRAYDGSPGEVYWQNFSSYTITAEIEPGSWKIKGAEKIEYTNNSPDSLRSIVIKTYPNHYKKGMPRSNQVPLETLTDGMVITNLTIDNVSVSIENNPDVEHFATYIKVHLPNPLPPKNGVTLNMEWTTEMPSKYVNRIGAYDKKSVFVGYWYPQIARYDDIDNWDEIEFLGIQEFNTDFADFNVKITVPNGYNVWATGSLQNPEEVFSDQQLKRYREAKTSRKPVTIIEGNNSPTESEGHEIWNYQASNVKDFAFGVSNTFKWKSQTVIVNDKEVMSNLVYDVDGNTTAERLLEAQEKSLTFLSNTSPGVTYPYSSFTTFIGVPEFGGMEFPMMANNGLSSREVENTDVTFHEIAHSYFPFFLGINEVKYSWMEEGWAIFFTTKFIQSYYKGGEDENTELNRNLNDLNKSAGSMWNVPLITPGYLLTYQPSHTQLAYRKSAFMYFTLENLLGEEVFEKCLKGYMERWSGKHPTPYDFMFTFSEISNRNLDWFWNAWIFQPGYGDLGLSDLDKNTSKVTIKNRGGLPLPIILKLTYKDGTEQLIERTAQVWSQDDNAIAIDIETIKNVVFIQLVTTHYPDSDNTNNLLEIKL